MSPTSLPCPAFQSLVRECGAAVGQPTTGPPGDEARASSPDNRNGTERKQRTMLKRIGLLPTLVL